MRKKGPLDDCFYVVEPLVGGFKVHKLSDEDRVYTVTNGECQCKAADYGAECRHLAMVENTLQGQPVRKDEISSAFDSLLIRLREAFSGSQIVSTLDYEPNDVVTRVPALATALLNEFGGDCVLWCGRGGILFRIECYKDQSDFKAALREARTRERAVR